MSINKKPVFISEVVIYDSNQYQVQNYVLPTLVYFAFQREVTRELNQSPFCLLPFSQKGNTALTVLFRVRIQGSQLPVGGYLLRLFIQPL